MERTSLRRTSVFVLSMLALALAASLACNPLSSVSDAPENAVTKITRVISRTPAPGAEEPAAPTKAQSKSGPAEPTQAPAVKGTPVAAQAPVGKIGQRIVAENTALTVTRTELHKGTADVEPSAGAVFLLVHIVLENVGDSDTFFTPDAFEIKDSTGKLIYTRHLEFLDDQLEPAEYAAGGKLEATVGFEVNQKAKGFHLLLDYGGDKPMDIDLGL